MATNNDNTAEDSRAYLRALLNEASSMLYGDDADLFEVAHIHSAVDRILDEGPDLGIAVEASLYADLADQQHLAERVRARRMIP